MLKEKIFESILKRNNSKVEESSTQPLNLEIESPVNRMESQETNNKMTDISDKKKTFWMRFDRRLWDMDSEDGNQLSPCHRRSLIRNEMKELKDKVKGQLLSDEQMEDYKKCMSNKWQSINTRIACKWNHVFKSDNKNDANVSEKEEISGPSISPSIKFMSGSTKMSICV